MRINSVPINERTVIVLKALENAEDHSLTTSEGKLATSIDSNDTVRTQFEKISEAGFADISDAKTSNFHIPPKKCELNSDGIEFVNEELEQIGDPDTLRDEVDHLAADVAQLQEDIEDADDYIAEIEERITALGEFALFIDEKMNLGPRAPDLSVFRD